MDHARDIVSQLMSFEVSRGTYRAELDQHDPPIEPPPEICAPFLEAAAEISWNRYPDDDELDAAHSALAGYLGVNPDNVLAAAGSDALILFILSVFGGPGRKVILFPPHYPIYSTFALLSSTEIISLPLNGNFQPDLESVRPNLGDADILVIANPNNPTGNLIDDEIIEEFLSYENLLVVLDEAYFEFSGKTYVEELDKHPNLIVLRTFSKAFGLAGLRFGYCAARPDYIEYIKRAIFAPYNLSRLQWALAKIVIENIEAVKPIIEQAESERGRIYSVLKSFDGLDPYWSAANFILFRVGERSGEVFRGLVERGILLRDFSENRYIPGCLRVTAGLPEENKLFLQEIKRLI